MAIFMGTAGDDALSGGNTADTLYGLEGNDTLTGGAGNDVLDGGEGSDSMAGGSGNDLYYVDDAGDVVGEGNSAGTDTVRTTLAEYTLGTNVENLIYSGSGDFRGLGNALRNTVTGGSGDDDLSGGGGNDTLYGLEGDDLLDGGSGADRLTGGAGNDFYYVDSTGDVVAEAGDEGTDTVRTTLGSYTLGANVETLEYTGGGNFAGTGNSLDNVLTGGAGNDRLDGGAGSDSLYGGLGNDTYMVDNAGDEVTEVDGAGTDLVRTTLASYTLGAYVEKLEYAGNAAFTGAGNAQDNAVTGGNAADILYGLDGNDTLTGGAGNDWLDGGEGNDVMSGGTGNDTYVVDEAGDVITEASGAGTDTVYALGTMYTLGANVENLFYAGNGAFTGIGNALNNALYGGTGADTLTGGAGNDLLDGGEGADDLSGGTGNDVYYVDSSSDVVTEGNSAGTDTVRAALPEYTLGANVEKLEFIGTGAFSGTGNALNNTITGGNDDDSLDGGAGNDSLTGGAGNDSLEGGLGADRMTGGSGNDSYFVDSTGDVVTEGNDAGTDTVRTTRSSYTLGANVENLDFIGGGNFAGTGNSLDNVLTGGAGNDVLSGGNGADTLVGMSGNDRLDGGAGADSLDGGLGNDTYIVDNADDEVMETDGAGTDTVRTTLAAYTLGAYAERLEYAWNAAFTGTGNELDNTITGGNAADILYGLQGNDTLTGGGGNDVLDGGAGNDSMVGGAGNDLYYVDDAGDVVGEGNSAGTDTVRTTLAEYTLGTNVENLIYSGSGDFRGLGNASNNNLTGGEGSDSLYGGAGNDALYGLDGDDLLDGGNGADRLTGGAGNDFYYVDSAGDVVTEVSDEGTDTIRTTRSSYTLGANVENLEYTGGGNFAGTGNSLDNVLTGSAGNDRLDGGVGSDSLYGGLGNDTYMVDNAGDEVTEVDGAGTDLVRTTLASYTLGAYVEKLEYAGNAAFNGTGNALNNVITGGNAADILYGLGGNDTLTGGGGNDVLDGGAGNDSMAGGAGNDTYYLDSAGDVVTEGNNAGTDTIYAGGNMFALGANVENLFYTGNSDFTGIGNALNNALYGGAGADSLTGGAGNDLLDGGEGADDLAGGTGNDTYSVDDAGDVVSEGNSAGTDTVRTTLDVYVLGANLENLFYTGFGDFTGTGNLLNNSLNGGEGSDSLYGGAGNDALYGMAGNDLLDGGNGADRMTGGTGDDVYYADSTGDVVTEGNNAGLDTVRTTLTNYALGANVENLQYMGGGNFTGTGNSLDNFLAGSAGNDVLSGGNGADTLVGMSGNDRLDGGAGADSLDGGLGNDTYIVDNAGDEVREEDGAGTDTVRTTLTAYTLGAYVEKLEYAGNAAFTGTGNALDNLITGGNAADIIYGLDGNDTLTGGGGNDVLDGGAGSDSMSGGSGNDLYYVDAAGDVVSEGNSAGTDTVRTTLDEYTLGTNVENLFYTGGGGFRGLGNASNNNLTGGEDSDSLYGGAGNDALYGLDGDDLLDGGSGADRLTGGAGNDFYYVDSAGDVVTEVSDEGTDTIRTTRSSYTLGANVENLEYTGGGNFAGTGNGLDNVLVGGAGNDVLDGGAGADQLFGGYGNDTYLVDNPGDEVAETDSAGLDLVRTALASYTLTDNVERLEFTGTTGFTGIGNMLDNAVTGGNSADNLYGLEGSDTLTGGAGNDGLFGGLGNDLLIGGAGADTYYYGKGEGFDIIAADAVNSQDTISFYNVTRDQLSWEFSGNDLVVNVEGYEGSLTVKDWKLGAGNEIVFQTTDASFSPHRFNIQFDYRFDYSGKITAGMRAALEAAAELWEDIIMDNFDTASAGTIVSGIIDPRTYDYTSTTVNYSVDDLVIFVAPIELPPGYEGVLALTPLISNDSDDDFEPSFGQILFNEDASWFIDSTPATSWDIPYYQYDFITVVAHEIGHVLGIGLSPAFTEHVSGYWFTGENAVSANGGTWVPLDNTMGHVYYADDLMYPYVMPGERNTPSAIDAGILADIGYQV